MKKNRITECFEVTATMNVMLDEEFEEKVYNACDEIQELLQSHYYDIFHEEYPYVNSQKLRGMAEDFALEIYKDIEFALIRNFGNVNYE